MGALIFLIVFSLLIAVGFLTAFCWAVQAGQFDDPVTPAYRLLTEDENDLLEQETGDLNT